MSKQKRNIGITAHIDAGKTTTTERILFYTGKNHRIGEVDQGQATMDFMEQEQDRGITISSAATTCIWKDTEINIIDTPGHVDFTAEVERSLRVLDGSIAIFCAVGAVEPQTETVWKQANTYKVPQIAYINKMDRLGADFYKAIDEIKTKLNANPIPLYLPIGSENDFNGIIDVLENKAVFFNQDDQGSTFEYKEINDTELQELRDMYYDNILDQLSSYNDEITDLYFEEKDVPKELIISTLRKETINRNILPTFVGSSLKNIGVQPLLDGVINFLPSPNEIEKQVGISLKKNEKVLIPGDPKGQALALIFKVTVDKEAGPLSFVRVYNGEIKKGTSILNITKTKKERVNRIVKMHANRQESVDSLKSGDIGVIIGFKQSQTGDTIGSEGYKVLLEKMEFPEPVISIAIESSSTSEQDKLKKALTNLQVEDPTFIFKDDIETGQLIISGMGELHLDVLTTRLIKEMKIPCRIGKPQVTYRESISKEVTSTYTFDKTIANKENYAEVTLKVEPTKEKTGCTYENLVNNRKVPAIYFEKIKEAINSSFNSGIVMGYAATDLKVTLLDVKYDELTSSELAFSSAAAMAYEEATRNAAPILLEPIMNVTISVPNANVGEAISSLTQRGGIVQSIESKTTNDIIHSLTPLAKLFGYSTDLRSATQGRGSFTMKFSHFAKKEN